MGKRTIPGEIVENSGKNWRMAMKRKKLEEGEGGYGRAERGTYMLAMRRNCSRRLRGRKVMMVYFEEMTWFVGWT